ncbi:MAG: hypothetical protein ACIAXF_09840 [Phycisphaerales bacterium JB063]
MNFSTDRDLLAYEPTLFNDVPFVAQQRVSVADAELAGTTVFSISADFDAAQVAAGSVVLIDRKPFEVIQRLDEATLTVSLPRTATSDPTIPGEEGTSLSLIARTFAPQAALVREALLRMLGIDENDPDNPLNEESVVSLGAMARLEALGTLERVYSSAAALTGNNEHHLIKANEYRKRFLATAARSPIRIDTNADGLPDEKRYLGLMRMTRV